MLRFRPFLFLLAALVLLPASSRAALIQTYDLTTLCFQSTDVVEARLTRHHLPGQEEWNDTFTATVISPVEGKYKIGDQINRLDLTLYDPARTGQHCLLFLTSKQDQDSFVKNPPPVRIVDMLLIDSHNRVRRYFQWSNPGGLAAEGFRLASIGPPSKITKTHHHGAVEYSYQDNEGFVEDDAAEQKFRPLAEERSLIMSKWATAKKLKMPPGQVLHQTER